MLTMRYDIVGPGGWREVSGNPLPDLRLAVRRTGPGRWTVDHVPTGWSAVPPGIALCSRVEALRFATALAALPLPWNARTQVDFVIPAEAREGLAALVEAFR